MEVSLDDPNALKFFNSDQLALELDSRRDS